MSKQRTGKKASTKPQTLVLRVDGSQELLEGKKTMEELRQLVGGYVELTNCVHEGRRCMLLVNEDGHSMNLWYNRHATELFHAACKSGTTDYIVGDAVVLLNWKLH